MTSKTDNQGTTTYGYDYEDRLVNAILPLNTTDFTYTGDGMRRSKTTGTDTANYLYDGISTVRETDGIGATIAYYTNNPTVLAGQITSRTDATDATSFYSYDGIGSTRNLTDQTQNQISGYSYDAFGNVLDHTGDDATYTFSTKEQDATGLYYFAARYYDPEIGRFINKDRFPTNLFDPQSLNVYLYCGNNPINRIDPTGWAYLDFNFTAGFGLGITTGFIMDDQTNWYFYLGGGVMTPGVGGSISASPYNPVTGWNAGVQIESIVYGQAGYAFGDKCGGFWELGSGASWPNVWSVAGTGFYVWDI